MAAAKKKPGTGVTLWQEQLKQAASKQAASEKVTGSFHSIGTRGGILSIDDTPIKGNELNAVVLMAVHENQFYADKFNPSVVQVPVCYAFAGEDEDEEDMKPHPDSSDPQCETCAACPHNEMGSADTGRGKACKNIRRLALVTEDAVDSEEAFEEAEVRVLKVPVTSTKNWAKHVKRLDEEVERPSWGVVTTIAALQDAKTQFKITFGFHTLVNFTQALFDAMQKKRAELAKEMVLPYSQPTEEAPAKPVRKSKAASHQVPGKRSVQATIKKPVRR